MGADVLVGTAEALGASCRWEYDDLPYWGGEVDCCINAWTLANGVWLGVDVEGVAQWFLDHQMATAAGTASGSRARPAGPSPSTLNFLEGLLASEVATGGSEELRAARLRGQEYLLERRLLRRLSTGEAVAPWVTHLAYPFRSSYSALHALDHFRAAVPG